MEGVGVLEVEDMSLFSSSLLAPHFFSLSLLLCLLSLRLITHLTLPPSLPSFSSLWHRHPSLLFFFFSLSSVHTLHCTDQP